VQVEQATGLPVGPTPIMVGVSPVMPPPVHQFGLPHQSATTVTQSLPSLVVPQSSLMQPHVLPSAMVPLQQLPLVSEQVGQSFILQMPKSLLLFVIVSCTILGCVAGSG
jgi:hypothetical protein